MYARKLIRLVIYPYGWHAHCPRVAIMYMIDSLMYMYSILSESKNMCKNYKKINIGCQIKLIKMTNIVDTINLIHANKIHELPKSFKHENIVAVEKKPL